MRPLAPTFVFVLVAARLCGQQPVPQKFTLVIPSVTRVALAQGGRVLVPDTAGRIRQFQVEIGAPASRRIQPGMIGLELDQTPCEAVSTTSPDKLVLQVKAVDEPDFLPAGSIHLLELKVRGQPELNSKWTIERAKDPFLTESVGDDDGVPVQISLLAPPLPLLLSAREARTFDIRAKVNRAHPAITLNGQNANAQTSPNGISSEISARIEITPDDTDLVIQATGSQHDGARLIIPVRRIGK